MNFPYLKETARKVADAFGLSYDDGVKIVGFYSSRGNDSGVDACAALDLETIKAAADAVGVALPDHEKKSGADGSKPRENTPKTRKNSPKKPDNIQNNNSISNKEINPEKGQDVNQDGGGALASVGIFSASGVPLNIEIVESIIDNFAISARLDDPGKMSGGQWSAACMLVGSYIKQHEILINPNKDGGRGARGFDLDKIDFVVDLFAFLCGKVRKAPLITDFLFFSGVSNSWLYNTNGRCVVTSAGVDVKKKLQDLQQAGIASGIVNDRENPTGKIYFSKAVLGWSETPAAVAVSDDRGGGLDALPLFKKPENP